MIAEKRKLFFSFLHIKQQQHLRKCFAVLAHCDAMHLV